MQAFSSLLFNRNMSIKKGVTRVFSKFISLGCDDKNSDKCCLYKNLVVVLFKKNLLGWLIVFNVPSTARSFRDGTPIYCPLRRTWSSINTTFRPWIEPRTVAWQSITLPLRYASSTNLLRLLKTIIPLHGAKLSGLQIDCDLDHYLNCDPEDALVYTGHLVNITKIVTLLFIVQPLLHHILPNIWFRIIQIAIQIECLHGIKILDPDRDL